MTTTETAKDGVEICSNYLKMINEITGLSPRVAILTQINRSSNPISVYAISVADDDAAKKVMRASGERVETQRLDNQKQRKPEPWRRLKDYFLVDRFLNNPLVEAEKEMLVVNDYDIELDFYMALDVPPGNGELEEVFFLFSTVEEKPIFENHLHEIRKIIS